MNQVYLSGIVVEAPLLSTAGENTPHARLSLSVAHRKADGEVKREWYRVCLWKQLAVWAAQNVRCGQRIAVQGYLTQRISSMGGLPQVEVTATEVLFRKPPEPRELPDTSQAVPVPEKEERMAG